MIRLLFLFAILIATGYALIKLVSGQELFSFSKCHECEGRGYWLGTRGDKNRCLVCEGTGKRS